jgi:assimilatory nitrate reductase catalytic subunit
MRQTRTTCPYCGVGCGLVVASDGSLAGDPDHPANRGRLCAKGAALGETLLDHDRLRHPALNAERVSWDAALDAVAGGFRDTIAAHGPDAVAFYVSGQFLTEDYYIANKLMKGFIGSANIDTNSRLCMASTVAGHVRAFGADVVPGIYEDWDEADLAVLVGSNAAWCHPVLFQRLMAARENRGTQLVVIDPRRTASCESADLHLPLAIGSDAVLFSGLLAYLADHGAVDRAWTEAHTVGLEDALTAARASAGSIGQVAAATGLAPDRIRRFYAGFAGTERSLTIFSQGVNQSASGTDKVNAILNCHLATGRIGRPGMGPFSVTGQPNAMGGREVGGLATQLAAHMRFDSGTDIDRVRRFWNAPAIATRPGLKAVDLFEAVHEGRIKAIWIAATNPLVSMPQAGRVREALARCPLVVVSDCWPSDTSALANIVLPAASWGEKEGTVTNSERRLSRQRAFREPPGAARPDWWMFSQVARRMGWGDSFAHAKPADIFREHAALSGFENDGSRAFDISGLAGLSDADYDSLEPVRWPVAGGRDNGRLFAAGGFFAADGRASLVAIVPQPLAEATSRARPFRLNTGRIRDQWHSMTRSGAVPRLMAHQEEPLLDLSPVDAGKFAVCAGDLMRVETEHGSAILRVRPSDGVKTGEIFVPMHWSEDFSSAGPVGRLVGAAADPFSGQPELKASAARLAPLPTLWRGLLLGPARPLARQGFYWARVPVPGGQVCTLRGWDPLPQGEALRMLAETLLGSRPDAERQEVWDEERGSYRFARIEDGRLTAALLLSCRSGWPLPARGAVTACLGAPFDAAARDNLMILEPAAAAPSVPARTVCACLAVSDAVIERAITARARSALEIGSLTGAGTNCGSCLPEIEAMLRERKSQAA